MKVMSYDLYIYIRLAYITFNNLLPDGVSFGGGPKRSSHGDLA